MIAGDKCALVVDEAVSPFSIFSPAKLNLFLAVTGRRADGFHELVSVVARLAWGDTLEAEIIEKDAALTLDCDDPAVPRDETNLVLRAARAFQAATGWNRGVRFCLTKRIPMGAGLGGGSSNGAMALRALNRLSGELLAPAALEVIAAQLGSDCALFLHGGPVVMRGRGERVELLPDNGAVRLRGRRVLIFKPGFSIATAWAYERLAVGGAASYLPAPEAEARLANWLAERSARAEALLFNYMEPVAFVKFPALPVLLDQLRGRFGLAPRMSGSGSACFALLDDAAPVQEITATIRSAWGESAVVVETRLE